MVEYLKASLSDACKQGDLNYIKESFKKVKPNNLYAQNLKDSIIIEAMKNEQIEILNYLLNLSKAIYKEEKCIVHASQFASSNNKLTVLKSIFDNFGNDKYLNEYLQNGSIVEPAAMLGYLNIIKYIFENDKLKNKVDIHARNDAIFVTAYQNQEFDMLKYFIFDLDIDITQHIKEIIKANKEVANMFDLRETNKSLHKELNLSGIDHKKRKI